MLAKLILIAEKIAFDDKGRLSATNLLLDTAHPSYPATLDTVDLLTLWTRGPDEPQKQMFQISLRVNDEWLPPEHVPVVFGEEYEAYQGISLDGFQIEKPGPIVFRFTQDGEDRGVWIMRAHALSSSASGEVGEAK